MIWNNIINYCRTVCCGFYLRTYSPQARTFVLAVDGHFRCYCPLASGHTNSFDLLPPRQYRQNTVKVNTLFYDICIKKGRPKACLAYYSK